MNNNESDIKRTGGMWKNENNKFKVLLYVRGIYYFSTNLHFFFLHSPFKEKANAK